MLVNLNNCIKNNLSNIDIILVITRVLKMRELTLNEMEFVAGAEAPTGPTDVIETMAAGVAVGTAFGAGMGLATGGIPGATVGGIAGGVVGGIAAGAASIYEYYTQQPQGTVTVEFDQTGGGYTEKTGGNY